MTRRYETSEPQDGDIMIYDASMEKWILRNIDTIESTGGQAEATTLRRHSHQGYWDGGWAGFLSGTN